MHYVHEDTITVQKVWDVCGFTHVVGLHSHKRIIWTSWTMRHKC